jgi:hypothetical protein
MRAVSNQNCISMICRKAKGEDVSSRLEMKDDEGDNIYSWSNKYVVQIYINKEMMLLRNITIESW